MSVAVNKTIAIVVVAEDEIHFVVDKISNLIDDIAVDDDENVAVGIVVVVDVVAVTMVDVIVVVAADEKMIVEVEMVDGFVHFVPEEYSFRLFVLLDDHWMQILVEHLMFVQNLHLLDDHLTQIPVEHLMFVRDLRWLDWLD